MQEIRFLYNHSVDDHTCQLLAPSSLRQLAFIGCEAITDQGLLHLSLGCAQLQSLELRECRNIRDSGLVHLNSLRLTNLSLLGCVNVKDSGLVEFLASNQTVAGLNLGGTTITSAGVLEMVRVKSPAL